MIATFVDDVRVRAAVYGDSLQPPCPPERRKRLIIVARDVLGCELPHGYLDLLSLVNGLDWNGFTLYADERSPLVGYPNRSVPGIIEANRLYREFDPMTALLVFGEDGDVLYVQDVDTQTCRVITKVGLSVLESYEDFESLVCSALRQHL